MDRREIRLSRRLACRAAVPGLRCAPSGLPACTSLAATSRRRKPGPETPIKLEPSEASSTKFLLFVPPIVQENAPNTSARACRRPHPTHSPRAGIGRVGTDRQASFLKNSPRAVRACPCTPEARHRNEVHPNRVTARRTAPPVHLPVVMPARTGSAASTHPGSHFLRPRGRGPRS